MGQKMKKKTKIEGSVAFGIMDGMITLLGVLLAMFAVGATKQTIIVAAIATAIADSTANAAGYHASEEAANNKGHSAAMRSSAFCFAATFIAMMIPMVPVFLLQSPISIYVAAVVSAVILFLLGVVVKNWEVGMEYLAIGVVSGFICFLVGYFIR